MLIFENKKMKIKTMFIVFIAIVILTGTPMWVVDYNQYANNGLIPFSGVVIAAFCAGILAYNTVHKKSKLTFYVIAAHMVAFLIKVFIDCSKDPTNHNLLPFEMLILLVLDTICCLGLVLIGREASTKSKI
jgi:hypothetical protein